MSSGAKRQSVGGPVDRHSRNPSLTSSPRPEAVSKSTRRQPDPNPPARPEPTVRYTLLVRLPFPRGDFEDPPQVEWNAEKDKRLWKIIANTPKIGDLHWEQVAAQFEVPLPFMLQQAAWLYQRHMESVREQMRKVGAVTAGSASPVPGGLAMKRLPSGGHSRTPSQLSVRPKESPAPLIGDASVPRPASRVGAPPISRTPSTNTVTQSRHLSTAQPPPSPRQPVQRSFRSSFPQAPRKMEPRPTAQIASSPSPPPASSSSSSSDSEADGPTRRSHMFRRPGARFQTHRRTEASADGGEDSDSGDSPLFATTNPAPANPSDTLREIRHPKAAEAQQDPSSEDPDISTASSGPLSPDPVPRSGPLTHPSHNPSGKDNKGKNRVSGAAAAALSSSASSASSANAYNPSRNPNPTDPRRPDGISPRHRAELARLNRQTPGRRTSSTGAGTKDAAGGSDGTPSMGSSFSDLDDTSITQSALEEALASNLRHGGGSRLSTFGHAFRSRYLQ